MFGHNFASQIPFDFLDEVSHPSNIDFYIKEVNSCLFGDLSKVDRVNINDALFYRDKIGSFRVKEGKEITFNRLSNKVEDLRIAILIANALIGYCIYQKNKFVLHASAIEYDNEAILFAGLSGSGKSSLSASFTQANFITEDVSYLVEKKDHFQLCGGSSLLKLSDEVANKIDGIENYKKISLKDDRLERNIYKLNVNAKENITVKCIYFLDWGESFSIRSLNAKELIARLLLSTFSCVPMNSCKESTGMMMHNASKIAENTPVFLLKRRKNLSFRDNKNIEGHFCRL